MKTASAVFLALCLASAGAARSAPPDSKVKAYSKAVIKLEPGMKFPGLDLPPGPFEDAEAALSNLKRAFDELKAAREAYLQAHQSCLMKSYTSQDIQRACAPDDTVEDCTIKLYAHCISPAMKRITFTLGRLESTHTKMEEAVRLIMVAARK